MIFLQELRATNNFIFLKFHIIYFLLIIRVVTRMYLLKFFITSSNAAKITHCNIVINLVCYRSREC